MSANNSSKDQIRSGRVQRLLATVKTRRKTVARKNFDEKLKTDFLPFLLAAQVGFAIGESLFKCELSDLCDRVKDDEGPHECHILVMRIAMGKTNGLKTLYGRVMRHKDIRLCPIGALGMYLAVRFHLMGEILDFRSNSTWFNVTLLIESSFSDSSNSISNQTYAKTMKAVCQKLNIVSKHFAHFGRSAGAVKAELEELEGDMIKNLGNLNPDTQEDRYSAKLPLQAMRIMAGHDRRKGSYFLPRSGVRPPEALSKMFFPFVEQQMGLIQGRF